MSAHTIALSGAQEAGLVVLRTLIGWHFCYEGVFKLLRPAWGRSGEPLEPFSSAGYLRGATGPLAEVFHVIGNSQWVGAIDIGVAVALFVIGLLLMLGLFTQAACTGAILLLAMFYISAIPWSGVPEPRTEGAYLIVNKNLIEAAAVFVVLSFRTGVIAGLDRRRLVRRRAEVTT
jgi:thiosulfate dehydrogenase [quinone] large subunit